MQSGLEYINMCVRVCIFNNVSNQVLVLSQDLYLETKIKTFINCTGVLLKPKTLVLDCLFVKPWGSCDHASFGDNL